MRGSKHKFLKKGSRGDCRHCESLSLISIPEKLVGNEREVNHHIQQRGSQDL